MDERRTALLIVDVQRSSINSHTKHVPGAVKRLETAYDLVWASRHIDFADHPWIGHATNAAGADEGAAALAFQAEPRTNVYGKHRYNALTAEIEAKLGEAGVGTLAICGIDTDGCVLATALACLEAGIRPMILLDACGSTGGPALHRAGVKILTRMLGDDHVDNGAEGPKQIQFRLLTPNNNRHAERRYESADGRWRIDRDRTDRTRREPAWRITERTPGGWIERGPSSLTRLRDCKTWIELNG